VTGPRATVPTTFLAFLPRWTAASRKCLPEDYWRLKCQPNFRRDPRVPGVAPPKSARSRNRSRKTPLGDVRHAEKPSKHRPFACPTARKSSAADDIFTIVASRGRATFSKYQPPNSRTSQEFGAWEFLLSSEMHVRSSRRFRTTR